MTANKATTIYKASGFDLKVRTENLLTSSVAFVERPGTAPGTGVSSIGAGIHTCQASSWRTRPGPVISIVLICKSEPNAVVPGE
jgi:hypothetical protein